MSLGPRLRKLALIAHISSSVGWLGAVVAFLALAITTLTTPDREVMRGAYLSMATVGWFVVVPASIASVLTGLLLGVGTPWGVVRHYWILAKLMINVVGNVALPIYMQQLDSMAGTLANPLATDVNLSSPVVHASVAMLGLVLATALSVYKPRGVTRYGARKQNQRRREAVNRGRQLRHTAVSMP